MKREWRAVVGTAKALGMYRTELLSFAAGESRRERFTFVHRVLHAVVEPQVQLGDVSIVVFG